MLRTENLDTMCSPSTVMLLGGIRKPNLGQCIDCIRVAAATRCGRVHSNGRGNKCGAAPPRRQHTQTYLRRQPECLCRYIMSFAGVLAAGASSNERLGLLQSADSNWNRSLSGRPGNCQSTFETTASESACAQAGQEPGGLSCSAPAAPNCSSGPKRDSRCRCCTPQRLQLQPLAAQLCTTTYTTPYNTQQRSTGPSSLPYSTQGSSRPCPPLLSNPAPSSPPTRTPSSHPSLRLLHTSAPASDGAAAAAAAAYMMQGSEDPATTNTPPDPHGNPTTTTISPPSPSSSADSRDPTSASSPAPGASVDPREAAQFAALAASWWTARGGPFAPLHALNPARVRFIRDSLCAAMGRDASAAEPLAGACGGRQGVGGVGLGVRGRAGVGWCTGHMFAGQGWSCCRVGAWVGMRALGAEGL